MVQIFAENLTKRHFHSSIRVKLERRGYTKNIGANFIKLLTSKFTHSFCILLVEFFKISSSENKSK